MLSIMSMGGGVTFALAPMVTRADGRAFHFTFNPGFLPMPTLHEVRERIMKGDLLSAEELEARAAEFGRQSGGDDGGAFIRWLADRQLLTDFQAEALAAGIAGPFMLGPYRVERHLTAGRLGHVFRGVHVEFNLPVSLKVFLTAVTADTEKKARMEREARVAIQLDHPNLIRTFQIGRVSDVHYLALEDLPRESLLARLDPRLADCCGKRRWASSIFIKMGSSIVTFRRPTCGSRRRNG
jgi:hypothetical protein